MLLLIRCKGRNNLLIFGCFMYVFYDFLKNSSKKTLKGLRIQKKAVPLHRF